MNTTYKYSLLRIYKVLYLFSSIKSLSRITALIIRSSPTRKSFPYWKIRGMSLFCQAHTFWLSLLHFMSGFY